MLALLSAMIIGLSLGLFGSGGSILSIPVLLYLLHMPAQIAIASSLLIVAGISLFGSIRNGMKQLISWRHVAWFGLPGMAGTYTGAWLGTLADPRWQLFLFCILMLVAAVIMWRHKPVQPITDKPFIHLKIITDGLVVGIITGFVGVGGGFLIVPALMLLGGLTMLVAIATSMVIIALKSVIGFAKYYSVLTGQGASFDWQIIGLMIVAGIVGSYVGGFLSQRMPKALLQRSFAVFLLLMAMLVLFQSVL